MTLSVVVRVGGFVEAAALDETLFSLAIQDWRDLEVVVVLDGGGDRLARAVAVAVEAQPWPAAPRHRLLGRGREGEQGALMNRAVAEAGGRFLTILDAGGAVVYQHGYAALVGRLSESGRAVAVGGCRVAHVRGERGRGFVVTKDDFTLGGSALGLFGRRRAPLCAHVIDRSRLGGFELSFGETARADRDFLARLYAAAEPDLSARHVYVCEQRLRADGLGSMLYAAARGGYRLKGRLRRARAKPGGASLDGGEIE
jgi:glycosyltransferase involved in cell wall biosynthesis